jgi:hypothetical protein
VDELGEGFRAHIESAFEVCVVIGDPIWDQRQYEGLWRGAASGNLRSQVLGIERVRVERQVGPVLLDGTNR